MTDTPAWPAPTADTPTPHPAWVDRGRRILAVASWITAGFSVVLTVVLIVLGVMNPGADDLVAGELADTLVWGSIFAAPISFTIAINLLIWRALLRGLSRRTRGQAVALVTVITLALAVASVLIVTALLLLGFFVGAFAGASTGFGA